MTLRETVSEDVVLETRTSDEMWAEGKKREAGIRRFRSGFFFATSLRFFFSTSVALLGNS